MSVTVAISTHPGYDRYIEGAVESALSYADEVIVYSDGPTDFEYPTVRVVSLPKTGYCVLARQTGIAEAQGDYLVHLDADDFLCARPPEFGDLAFGDMFLCDENGAYREKWDFSDRPRTRAAAFGFMRARMGTLYGRNPIPGKCSFRVKWLRDNGLSWYTWPHTTFGEDVRTIIEYLEHEPVIEYTRSPYYVYRMHGDQDTKNLERRDTFMHDIDAYLQGEACTHESTP